MTPKYARASIGRSFTLVPAKIHRTRLFCGFTKVRVMQSNRGRLCVEKAQGYAQPKTLIGVTSIRTT